MKATKLIVGTLAALNVAVPFIRQALGRPDMYDRYDNIRELTPEFGSATLACYILPGIVAPPFPEYKMFAENASYEFPGNMYFVDYGAVDYNPDAVAELILDHAASHGFSTVRLLTISIGDQLVPAIDRRLEEGNFFGLEVENYAIDPCVEPDALWESVRRPLKIGMPFAKIAKFALGWLGEQRIIPWDCEMRSFTEIEEQAWAITYRSFSYRDLKAVKFKAALISAENEFMDPEKVAALHYPHRTYWVHATKHCRFSENWYGYLDPLADAGFYDKATEK